jgi:hypothetical protein
MRAFKLISALAMALALTSIAAATASAANPPVFLPGAPKTTFINGSGKATLTTASGLSIVCEKSTSTGELLGVGTEDSKEALMIIDFETCKTEPGGLGANSVGDPAKTILVHVEAKSCTITESPLVGGILLKLLPVTLEVPTVKLTSKFEEGSDVIGRLLPENTAASRLSFDLNAPGGVQEFKECKDKAGETALKEGLKIKVDEKAIEADSVEAKEGFIEFKVKQAWET